MSAFCFSPEVIDFQLFNLWLSGCSVSSAAQAREAFEKDASLLRELGNLLEVDTADHFRLFDTLQPHLEEPSCISCLLELSPQVLAKMYDQFYSFDASVMLQFLGRRFTARARKDWLGEVNENTGIARRSCLRQYDNLRRLFDAGDEVGFQLGDPNMFEVEFRISKPLIAKYEEVLFLMHHRFNIKRTKNKSITLAHYSLCSRTILSSSWVLPGTFDFDTSLLAKFREIKTRLIAIECFEEVLFESTQVSRKRFETLFKPWFRSFLNCGTGRDLKDFFEDLEAEVIDKLGAMQLDKVFGEPYLENFFHALSHSVLTNLTSTTDESTWRAYLEVLRPCIVCMVV